MIRKDWMFYRFSLYGFLKNLRFFDPFIILFFREMGMSFFEIGSLYAIRDIATNILEIPTGIYADAYGRRMSMIMSFISYIISFSIFYFFSKFYLYAIAMIFFAFGEAFRTGTHKALILEYLRLNDMTSTKVEYYGNTRSASQFGSAINSLLAAGLVFYCGSYRYIFIITVIPYIFNLINLATYPKYLDGDLRKFQRGMIKSQMRSTLKDFSGIFKNFGSIKAILNSSVYTSFFKSTKEYLQPILKLLTLSIPIFLSLKNIKRSSIIIGIVYFFIFLLTSYSSKNAAKFSKKFKNLASAINITFIIGIFSLIIIGILIYFKLNILAVVLFLVLYILNNLRRPMNVGYISDKISHKTMASGLSVESQVTTILMAILAPVAGLFADHFGIGIALGFMGLLMLISYFFVKI
ncbi:MFS transporter [bacterium]|nr:MFS transporter [bacterium]